MFPYVPLLYYNYSCYSHISHDVPINFHIFAIGHKSAGQPPWQENLAEAPYFVHMDPMKLFELGLQVALELLG